MAVIGWTSVFFFSLLVLVKASDVFTDSAERIGLRFGLSEFIVGVTVVALGTSLPELISSVFSVIDGVPTMVSGNVVGSNISNILLILGLGAFFGKRLKISKDLVKVDLPFLVGSAFFLLVAVWDGVFGRIEALIFLFGLTVYMVYNITEKEEKTVDVVEEEIIEESGPGTFSNMTYLLFSISLVFVFVSAKYMVDSVVVLGTLLGIGPDIIALTAVSIGTSLPEIAVSVTAAVKGNSDIAVGNILGSNIFNTFAVMGIPGMMSVLTVSDIVRSFGIPVMIMATLLYFFMTQDREITLWEGTVLLMFFLLYLVKLFSLV